MKHPDQNPGPSPDKSSIFLDVSCAGGSASLPLHSSITLFLLSYTQCSSFTVYLVSDHPHTLQVLSAELPHSVCVCEVRRADVPVLVRSTRLPAVLDSGFCRAGLAVVLRHIIQKSCCGSNPDHTGVASLLGFKNTCLKACAEVSQWTRLCEMEVPSAVEEHLRNPSEENLHLPAAILHLEQRLSEPVRVHNDDKIRRQKLQLQRNKHQKPAQKDTDHPKTPPKTEGPRTEKTSTCETLREDRSTGEVEKTSTSETLSTGEVEKTSTSETLSTGEVEKTSTSETLSTGVVEKTSTSETLSTGEVEKTSTSETLSTDEVEKTSTSETLSTGEVEKTSTSETLSTGVVEKTSTSETLSTGVVEKTSTSDAGGEDISTGVSDAGEEDISTGAGGVGVELRAALQKLSAVPGVSSRRSSEIRRVSSRDLPELDHVFAEGLYFTLTDLVLLPCIHHYLSSVQVYAPGVLLRLPLLLRWYTRVQELPCVQRAAEDCGISLFRPRVSRTCTINSENLTPSKPEQEKPKQEHFIGGPRPTLTKLQESGIQAVFSPHPCPSWSLNWESLPSAVNPTEGKMSDTRALRKRQQLNNLVAMVTELARPGDTIVDFCSGGGHVGIVLAHELPACQVILVENKEESLVRARDRSSQLGLKNIGFIQANLDYFTGTFQIGVALHACGVATDMVLDRCVQVRAGFVISPCCYGFIQNTLKFSFPRSKKFAETLTYKEHMILCRFADQTAVQLPPDRRLIGKCCMGLVDLDRSWAVETRGYSVRVMTMEPETCSPKNNMLVGVPAEKNTDLQL